MKVHVQQEGTGLCTGASRLRKGVCFRRGGHCSPQARTSSQTHTTGAVAPHNSSPTDIKTRRHTPLGHTTSQKHNRRTHNPSDTICPLGSHPSDSHALDAQSLNSQSEDSPLRHTTFKAQQHTQTSKPGPAHRWQSKDTAARASSRPASSGCPTHLLRLDPRTRVHGSAAAAQSDRRSAATGAFRAGGPARGR